MPLRRHVVKDEEVEGTIDGGARVVVNGGVDIGEWTINIWGRRRDQSQEVSLEGHCIISILDFRSEFLIVKVNASSYVKIT